MAEKYPDMYHVALVVAGVLFILAVSLLAYSFSGSAYTSTNPNSSTNQSACIYGYKCGIAADGCAVAGAIYNCPNEPVNITPSNYTVAVNLTQELNNSARLGFTLNQSMFYSNSASACSKQLITSCDNNVPDQFVCVNQQYSGVVSSQYKNVSKPTPCPMFILAGNISCGVVSNYCVVLHQSTV